MLWQVHQASWILRGREMNQKVPFLAEIFNENIPIVKCHAFNILRSALLNNQSKSLLSTMNSISLIGSALARSDEKSRETALNGWIDWLHGILLMRILNAQQNCQMSDTFSSIFCIYFWAFGDLKHHFLFLIGKEIHKTDIAHHIGSNENQKRHNDRGFFLVFQASIVRHIRTSLDFVKLADREFRLIWPITILAYIIFEIKKY